MPTRRDAAAYLASGGRIYVDRRGWWPRSAALVLVALAGVAAAVTVLWVTHPGW